MSESTAGSVLIVEDSAIIRKLIKDQVTKFGYKAYEAENGLKGLEAMRTTPPDCVILDLMMPEMSGPEVLAKMQEDASLKNIPVIVVTALGDMDKIIYCIEQGAADYMQKPFRAPILKARLNSCIERKKLHDREMALQQELELHNIQLAEKVKAQVKEITAAQLSAIFGMCKLAESRDVDTGAHLERVQEFSQLIAKHRMMRAKPGENFSPDFPENMAISSPLHDIGKVGVSDLILQKPGKLTLEEFEIMKSHTLIGASLLADVNKQHPDNTFIKTGMEIARSHHEKWDGSGYPQGLSGEEIPLSARIVAIADVYDALTHARCYKPAFSHQDSFRIIVEGSGKHFDPELVNIFIACEDEFIGIMKRLDGLE